MIYYMTHTTHVDILRIINFYTILSEFVLWILRINIHISFSI